MTRRMKEARESKQTYVESSKTIREKIQNLKALRDWSWILQAEFAPHDEHNLLQTSGLLKDDQKCVKTTFHSDGSASKFKSALKK